ncbi:hypothetical protein B0J12DRAFT_642626 [Macrophomina phaseolina]|uniref:Uncharacterized protein n=1 Tax=Macrophomina phaseolina TaxID=35725 RepID=A0ABQ8GSC9_9PEZI|nr:hypothetical protein B0J12DRAFT_642626 [Macrophomina phaseolina]
MPFHIGFSTVSVTTSPLRLKMAPWCCHPAYPLSHTRHQLQRGHNMLPHFFLKQCLYPHPTSTRPHCTHHYLHTPQNLLSFFCPRLNDQANDIITALPPPPPSPVGELSHCPVTPRCTSHTAITPPSKCSRRAYLAVPLQMHALLTVLMTAGKFFFFSTLKGRKRRGRGSGRCLRLAGGGWCDFGAGWAG